MSEKDSSGIKNNTSSSSMNCSSTSSSVGTESSSVSTTQEGTGSSFVTSRLKIPVHVEVEIKRNCPLKALDVNPRVRDVLSSQYTIFQNGLLPAPVALADLVDRITVTDLSEDQKVSFWQAELSVHSFRMLEDEPEAEYLEGESGDLPLGEQLELPNKHLQGLWESIIVEESIKSMLLNYCSTSLLFAGNNVDANLISWNKMILLHGPPGMFKMNFLRISSYGVLIIFMLHIYYLCRNWKDITL